MPYKVNINVDPQRKIQLILEARTLQPNYFNFKVPLMAELGHMKFKRKLKQFQLNIIKEAELDSMLQLQSWWLAEGQFDYKDFNQIFQVCEAITAKKIDFYQNSRPTIINEIIHINFPYLSEIIFTCDKIESIEQLQHLKAQNLLNLSLNGNNISEIKSLRKCCFPKLRKLNLSDNNIIDFSTLSQCGWKQLNTLHLDIQQNDEGPAEDFLFFFKMQPNIQTTSFKRSSLLVNGPFATILTKRYNKLSLQ